MFKPLCLVSILTTRVLKYLVLLAIGLLIVAISSFWLSGPSFKEGDVVLEIEGPTQISSGEEVVYKLKYKNETRSTLHDINLVFFYPEGSTVLVGDGVETDYVEDFKIDELGSGESGEKEFSAFLLGEKGNIKIAKATLTFKPGNLTSFFEKTATLSTTVITTPISLTLVTPPSTVSGGAIEYILDYRNQSDEGANDLWLEFDYPDGFRSKGFNPLPDSGNNVWLVKVLSQGGGGRISITGTLTGQEGENKVASAVLKRKVGGEYVDYQKVSTATVISNPVFGLSVVANDTTDYSASLGDRLTYLIKYKNNSNFTFSGVTLSLRLEGDMFDYSSLNTRGGFYDDTNKTITWDPSSVPEFGNFWPNTEGRIEVSIVLKSVFASAISGSSSDRFVKVTAKLGTQNIPSGFSGNEVSVMSSLVTKISTQPSFNQAAYYNDPNFGSLGPLPPKVGEETYFTVHWQLSNPGNDAEGVRVAGKLPSGVEWVNMTKTTEGQPSPTFNPNTSEVSWVLDRLPYGTGVSIPKYEASFRIKIKPSSLQRGSIVPLLENIKFTGNDSFTKESFTINKGNVNSDNLTDRPREGTVQ